MIFYEIKIHYTRQTGDDANVVKETYLVEGLTCADVEERLIRELKTFMAGDWEIKSCKQVQFYDLLPNPAGDKWYKGRVELITIEENGKETRKAVSIYAQAGNTTEADKQLRQQLANLDCEIVSISRTPIMDVLRGVD